jgi:hypothetical protein
MGKFLEEGLLGKTKLRYMDNLKMGPREIGYEGGRKI